MGRKLSKQELKRITTVAKNIRQRAGIKGVVKTTKYKMKWTDAIKKASKEVLSERTIKQKRLRFK
ncbi:MAG: hypothetical protein PHH23_06715 [Paludibacteraceae bacterium]|nr:hypothetical protein [Paludibacteraceae bacterium]